MLSDALVTICRSDRRYDGYTLFCHTYEDPRTGRGGVAHVVLVDMAGNPVHEWTARMAVQLLELLPDGSLYYSTRGQVPDRGAGVGGIGRRQTPTADGRTHHRAPAVRCNTRMRPVLRASRLAVPPQKGQVPMAHGRCRA